MTGSYNAHLERFGICNCGNPSGETEIMELEVKNERTGNYSTKMVPACADCFGIL